MSSLLLVLLSSVLVTTIVLAHMPRWRPFVTPTGIFDAARATAIVCLVAVPVTAMLSWLLAKTVLDPWQLEYLRTPAFVAIALTIVPLIELALRRRGNLVPQRPGFALVMSTNTGILGIALITDLRTSTFLDASFFVVGSAASLAVLLVSFAALYERLQSADVPAAFREAPLALVTAGIMALAFMGFTGLIQE